MPQGGAYILRDVRAQKIVIVCERCDRRGQYDTARLIEKYGAEAGLPGLLSQLARCRDPLASGGLDGCKAHYSKETVASWLQ